jgi:hypothetical protein
MKTTLGDSNEAADHGFYAKDKESGCGGGSDDGSEQVMGARRALAINKLTLMYTTDAGVSQLEIEMAGERTRQHPRGQFWVWPAVLGLTYYVTIDAELPLAECKVLGFR